MFRFKGSSQREGKETLFSNRDLRRIIIPLLLSQILSVLVGTIDTMMVSYAGEDAVSGVSLVSSLDVFLLIFFTSTIGGGAVVLSQSIGSKQYKEMHETAKQLLYIVTALATVLTVVVSIFRVSLLSTLFGDADASVMQNAKEYMFFLALSYPFVAIQDGIGASFVASGNTRISLIVSIILNVINIVMNAVLIYGVGIGAAGAAIATLIARIFGAAIMLILILDKRRVIHIEKIFRYRPNIRIIKRILGIGIPNGLENAMFQFGRLLTQSLVSALGTAALAANSVALGIANFQYMTGNAFSSAMIVVVGTCVGAQKRRQAKRDSFKLLAFNYLVIWMVILATLLFLNPIVDVYSLSDGSAKLAKQMLLLHSVFAATIWPVGFMLPSAFRAAGNVRFPMVVSMLSMWIFRVAGAYVCALETVSVFGLFSFPGLGMGIWGVWLAMIIDWVFRFAVYLIHYLRNKWLCLGLRVRLVSVKKKEKEKERETASLGR